jgi:hypothetical protein
MDLLAHFSCLRQRSPSPSHTRTTNETELGYTQKVSLDRGCGRGSHFITQLSLFVCLFCGFFQSLLEAAYLEAHKRGCSSSAIVAM